MTKRAAPATYTGKTGATLAGAARAHFRRVPIAVDAQRLGFLEQTVKSECAKSTRLGNDDENPMILFKRLA